MKISRLKSIVAQPFAEIVNDLGKLASIANAYIYIFGPIDGCLTCGDNKKNYENFYNRLKTEGVSIMENLTEQKFNLNKDVKNKQMEFGSSVFISWNNCTDEQAIEWLAGNKKRIINFEKYPENWEELVAEYKEKVAAEKAAALEEKAEVKKEEVVEPVVDAATALVDTTTAAVDTTVSPDATAEVKKEEVVPAGTAKNTTKAKTK